MAMQQSAGRVCDEQTVLPRQGHDGCHSVHFLPGGWFGFELLVVYLPGRENRVERALWNSGGVMKH